MESSNQKSEAGLRQSASLAIVVCAAMLTGLGLPYLKVVLLFMLLVMLAVMVLSTNLH